MKIDPFPVILFGTDYWTGLVEWMRGRLAPDFIDLEDIDIFRIVDRPKDAVAIVKEGQKNHWWRPSNGRLKLISKNGGSGMGRCRDRIRKTRARGRATASARRRTKTRHAVAAEEIDVVIVCRKFGECVHRLRFKIGARNLLRGTPDDLIVAQKIVGVQRQNCRTRDSVIRATSFTSWT